MEYYNPDMPLKNLSKIENYIWICCMTLLKIMFSPLILIGFLIYKLNKKFSKQKEAEVEE